MTRRKQRNPFEALLGMCKKNGIYQKPDGSWAIDSSTNRRRMEKTGSCVGGSAGEKSKTWTPAKVLITAKDLEIQWNKQDGKCYWFGNPLDLGLLYKNHPDWYSKHPAAPSVDKIDESGDYTPNNIVITSRFANLGRNIYPHNRMLDFVQTIKNNLLLKD